MFAPLHRFIMWLSGSSDALPIWVQRQLLIHSLTKKRTLVFSMLASLTVALIAAAITRQTWAFVWLGLEVIFAAIRWACVVAFERAEMRGQRGNATAPILAGLLWVAMLATAFVFCVASGSWPLILLSGMTVASFIGGVSSRNAGTPRYGTIVMLLIITPYLLALATTDFPYAPLLALPLILGVIGMIAVLRENHRVLVELFCAQHENDRLARSDPLTGLSNRATKHEQLTKWLDRARSGEGRNQHLCVLYLDLDGFKAVNDRWGHLAGDRILQLVATRLQENVRNDDVVARVGGDEFVMILPRTAADEAAHIAQRIIARIAEPYEIGPGKFVRLGISIGGAAFPGDGETADHLLANADAALYAAKRQGAQRYVEASVVAGAVISLAPGLPVDRPGPAAASDRTVARSR